MDTSCAAAFWDGKQRSMRHDTLNAPMVINLVIKIFLVFALIRARPVKNGIQGPGAYILLETKLLGLRFHSHMFRFIFYKKFEHFELFY
jgi:hypothetical protein